jgi:hypothetical protein
MTGRKSKATTIRRLRNPAAARNTETPRGLIQLQRFCDSGSERQGQLDSAGGFPSVLYYRA